MAIEIRPPELPQSARLRAAVGSAVSAATKAFRSRTVGLSTGTWERLAAPTCIAAAAVLPMVLIAGMTVISALALVAIVAIIERAIRYLRPASIFIRTTAVERGATRGEATIWATVVDAIPDAAVVLAADNTVEHFNQMARDVLPRVRAGVPVAHVTRDPELLAAIDALATDTSGAARVVVMRDRVPIERRIAARIATVGRVGTERPSHIVVTFRDLTEQDRLAELRADFIANASHELRTPLASLRGFVETLQGPARNDPAARDRFLAIMSEQAARMTRLIDDLLSLSRVEMHAHLPPKGRVDLGEVAAFVTRELESIAQSASIRLHVEPLPQPALVRGDRDELVQVIQNLMQNAIKYGRPGGNVWVRLSRDVSSGRPQVTATVADDGPGIASEHIPRLTERFYRVNVSASREKGGTGLGLAIVKHIINRHGGELRIASTLGKGSSFSATLDEIE